MKNPFHKAPQSPAHNFTPCPDLRDWLRLFRTDNIGPVTFYQLLETYGSAAKALDALPELSARGGRKKPLCAPDESLIEREIEKLTKLGGVMITRNNPLYPEQLAQLNDAPPVLSLLGDLSLLTRRQIAVVGARNASINGKKFTHKLTTDLGRHGYVITSGFARGIDSAAHLGALNTGTIAVMAGGIDYIYPQENETLYKQICETGLFIAETKVGTPPKAIHFPRRNRIVAGLSECLIVIEATHKSGSLITARMAGDYGRDVMAVPGHPLDPRAGGPNALIRDGAVLIRYADDVIEALNTLPDLFGLRDSQDQQANFHPPISLPKKIDDDTRQMLLDELSIVPTTVDELVRTCQLNIAIVQTILLELELAGRVKRLPAGRIELIEE